MADDDEFERILFLSPEVFVYKVPPRGPSGYIAGDWKETDFLWKGRVKVVEKGIKCDIRLEDPATGKLFASCPVDDQQDKAVERVQDSSRYFVLRVVNGTRIAFLGMGFKERNDAFEFNVALEDHSKELERQKNDKLDPPELRKIEPSLDLGLKSGQTITVNLKNAARKNDDGSSVPSSGFGGLNLGGGGGGGGFGILPPPPSASRTRTAIPSSQPAAQNSSEFDMFGTKPTPQPATQNFAAFGMNPSPAATNNRNPSPISSFPQQQQPQFQQQQQQFQQQPQFRQQQQQQPQFQQQQFQPSQSSNSSSKTAFFDDLLSQPLPKVSVKPGNPLDDFLN